MTGLSDAAEYAVAQARKRMAEQKLGHCQCGVPCDRCALHKPKPETSTKGTERVAPVRAALAAARADTEEPT